jgi:SAM-dependent methyltransferase
VDVDRSPSPSRRSRLELFRLALAELDDPDTFYRTLADDTMARFAFPVAGRRVLDLGCGHGELGHALARAGAGVLAVDLDLANCVHARRGGSAVSRADGRRLPFADATFDGVVCSNLLEHTPTPERILDEIARVVRPGGWAWISWTNWYSPWGGHLISPWHYLGPRVGARVHRRLFGRPSRTVPFESLWPTHIGAMLAEVERRPFRVLDVLARYYPGQRWITRIPGWRELATWNCLLLLERVTT